MRYWRKNSVYDRWSKNSKCRRGWFRQAKNGVGHVVVIVPSRNWRQYICISLTKALRSAWSRWLIQNGHSSSSCSWVSSSGTPRRKMRCRTGQWYPSRDKQLASQPTPYQQRSTHISPRIVFLLKIERFRIIRTLGVLTEWTCPSRIPIS